MGTVLTAGHRIFGAHAARCGRQQLRSSLTNPLDARAAVLAASFASGHLATESLGGHSQARA
ncbi:MAG: hypothetical protein WCC30_08230 [Candidatus Dormiibacterota bacterium]